MHALLCPQEQGAQVCVGGFLASRGSGGGCEGGGGGVWSYAVGRQVSSEWAEGPGGWGKGQGGEEAWL